MKPYYWQSVSFILVFRIHAKNTLPFRDISVTTLARDVQRDTRARDTRPTTRYETVRYTKQANSAIELFGLTVEADYFALST